MLLNEFDMRVLLAVTASFSHASLLPDIRNVENREIKNLLGKDLYNSLNDSYNAPSPALTTEEIELLSYVQPVIGNLAICQYLDKGNVIIDDNGISAIHSDTKKPAFEWQVRELKKSYKRTGLNAIDDLILFLEENISNYPDWAISTANEEAREMMVNSPIQFQKYVDIKESRGMYRSLFPIMKRVELEELSGTISKELYEELRDQLKPLTVSLTNADLLYNVRGAVAHLSWAKALNEFAVVIDEDGIHLLNNTFSGTVKGMAPAETARVRVITEEHMGIGLGYLEKLKNYLQANADLYPLYLASDCYIDTENDETDQFVNDPDSGIVMM